MAKTKTISWDAAEHLNSEEEMAAYLEAAQEEGEPSLVAAAHGDIARARGMAQLARELKPRLFYKQVHCKTAFRGVL